MNLQGLKRVDGEMMGQDCHRTDLFGASEWTMLRRAEYQSEVMILIHDSDSDDCDEQSVQGVRCSRHLSGSTE